MRSAIVGLVVLMLSSLAPGRGLADGEIGRLRGAVHAADDNAPLAGATIRLVTTGEVITTDAEGRFVVDQLAAGRQQLVVSADGYADAVIVVEVVAGRDHDAVAALAPQGAIGDELVVTGTRFPEKRLEAPVTVERVDGDAVAQRGGSSYLAALAGVKGLDFADTGVNEKRVSARGFSSQFNSRMLTMVDGRLAQLPGNGLPQGNLLPTASLDVKSVEVVIGPASALYGPNAHTGVVNVITKTPWDQSGASIALRGGTQDLLDGSARVAGTFGRFGWKLGGQLLRAEDVAPDRALMSHWYGRAGQPLVFEGDLVGGYATSAAKVEGSGYFREGGLQLKAGYGLSQNTGFTLTNAGRNHIRDWRVQYQTVQLSHPRWYAQVTRTVGDAGQSYQLDRLAQVTQAMGGVPEDAAALERQRDAIEFVDESELWDSELQHRRAIGALKLTTGAQARLYRPYSAGTYLDDADERLRAGELGGYVQLDHPVLPGRLRLVGAARLDAHSAYAPQLSPKAAAVVTLAPTHHVRAGYNRAFKSPTILENHLRINDVLLGNADGYEIRDASGAVLAEIAPLEPETVDALELGYKGAFGDRLLVDAVAYYSFYQRFISPLTQRADPAQGTFGYTSDGRLVAEGTPAAGTLFTYANFGRAQVAGGDLGVELALARELSLQASASFIHLVEFEAGDATQAALRLNVPEVKLRGALSARDLGVDGSFASVAARWQSAYVFEAGRWSSAALVPGGQLPARLVVDLNLGWRTPQGVTVSLNVLNLLGDEGVDVLGAPPGERLAWLQVAYELDGLAY